MKSCWIVPKNHKAELEWRDVAVPAPNADEIVVRVHATALNRGEIVMGSVVHGHGDKIGGTEAAGVVHAMGEGVTGLRVGDRVMGRVQGGFAEYARMSAHQAMPVPAHLNWEQAAAIPVSFLTAYEMLYAPYGKLKAGEWLLVTGASAGAGVTSIQLAKLIGAHTIGTSGSAQKLEKLKAVGLDVGIHTRAADFAPRVREVTGGNGADVIVNLVGGSMFAECVRALARRGRLAVVGYVDGVYNAEIDLAAVHANRYEIFGISNVRLTGEERAHAVRGFVRDALPAVADGRVVPLIDRVYDFDQLPAAKAFMESNAMIGKIVVRVT